MIYVMSDIHGDFQSFYKMLRNIDFSSSDKLYVLGDAVDKGEENLRLLEFIRNTANVHMIKGNHEYLLERYLQGTVTAELWDACGGAATRKEADKLSREKKKELLEVLKGLPIYQTITLGDTEYFLTHSGYHADFEITVPGARVVDIQASVERAVSWDQEQYLFSDDIHFIPSRIKFNKRVVVGHYPTLLLPEHGKPRIYQGKTYIDIDTGNERRAEGGRLACFRLNDGQEYYV